MSQILVVDDEVGIRELLSEILRDEGHQVRLAQNATEARQIRNAHYLLGEVAYKLGDSDQAHFHFDELAKFYPQFRNLKSLLFAIDLRSMVNLKL